MKRLLAALLLAASVGRLVAQESPEELEKFLRSLTSDERFVQMLIDEQNPPARLVPVFREHLEMVYSSKVFIKALADETYEFARSIDGVDDEKAFALGREFGTALVQAKTADGIRRLPVDQQRELLSIALEVFSQMSLQQCAAAFRNQLDAVKSAQAETDALMRLSEDTVRRYLYLNRMALNAELREDPPYVPLAPSERSVAQQVFESQFIEALLAHPRSEELLRASDFGAAPASDVCAFGMLTIDTAVSVPGQSGDWVVRYISE
jgi:hypothetical protein